MRKYLSTVFLILAFFAGLSLLLYPSVSDWWNDRVHSKAIATYVEAIEQMNSEYPKMLDDARAYNESLVDNPKRFFMDDLEREQYQALLSTVKGGIMSYIEIPSIHVTLPIYHGTDEAVLQVGVGHLEGTSLPVGGESTHCALSGHRGLPSAKLFTNLNKLELGDLFFIRTLSELLTYQVDQVLIVEPAEVDELDIVPGRDYCTLITCTPYGVNSHRLLVRGTRVENPKEAAVLTIVAEAHEIDSLLLAPVLAAPVLLVLFLGVMLWPKKKQRKAS